MSHQAQILRSSSCSNPNEGRALPTSVALAPRPSTEKVADVCLPDNPREVSEAHADLFVEI